MSHTRVLFRTLAAAAAAAAVAAPGAVARPVDTHAAPTQRGLAVPFHLYQDLRSPDARDAASPTPVPGLPTFPAAVTPVPKPVVHHPTTVDDGGISGATIGFGIGGLVLVAGLAGLGAASRRRASRARVAV